MRLVPAQLRPLKRFFVKLLASECSSSGGSLVSRFLPNLCSLLLNPPLLLDFPSSKIAVLLLANMLLADVDSLDLRE
jgi:hypothetical protein